MSKTVLSVRVPEELKDQLDFLAKATRRSKAFLAEEAIAEYIKRNAWKAKELQKAVTEADKGAFISQGAMETWVDSLGSDEELSPPKADISLNKTP